MGTLIAIGVVWFVLSRSEDPRTRQKQRKIGAAVTAASLLWFLDAVVNADRTTTR
jgi:low temperature requirement protein LtrA